ncbi:MAG: glycosyltransferase family 2 protein [Spirochaetales bacterium]|nr:glycosyltransferase family 2 protein [Spirochaetales bacterium]
MSFASEFRPCVIIPVYNHGSTVGDVVDACADHGLPVMLIDDGSNADTKKQLRAITRRMDNCALHTLPVNRGKGSAVAYGLKKAYEAGFSHALQIDADGQHDLEQIVIFLDQAHKVPDMLIAGQPIYDDSAPTSRKIGREITNFWVMVETISREIPDAMCGFRVYPLTACHRLLSSKRLSLRMEFDIEILVRLYWMGVRMKFLPIKIIYPEGGRSHFHLFRDNLAISRIHTILFFNMLIKFPHLILKKIKRHLKKGESR